MGLLTEQCDENNILTENDFKHKGSSVTGQLDDCYEKCIGVGPYYAWIALTRPMAKDRGFLVAAESVSADQFISDRSYPKLGLCH